MLFWYLFSGLFPSNSSIRTSRIGSLLSVIAKTRSSCHNINNFRHPTLSQEEHRSGTRLGIDSWADTSCAGKHAYVEEFIVGKTITATGFSSALGSLADLPMANVLYAHDLEDGTVVLLEVNNSIYMAENMNDSLLNPIQAEEEDVRVDLRPKRYYPSEPLAQSITFPDGTVIPVDYDGVLPYIPIR